MSVLKSRHVLYHDVSLAEYSSWRTGGPAKNLYKPENLEDLKQFLCQLPEDEPLLWLGLGSNTLIRDGGFAGTVIITQGGLNELVQTGPLTVRAGAGVSCAAMARFCARLGLAGVEFLAGVPGTIGGALRMNAGCFNGQTWEHVIEVERVDRKGLISVEMPQHFDIAYRHVEPLDKTSQHWFVSGTFQLTPGNKSESLEKIKTLLERRTKTQPTNEANCGSVFRNPPNDFAARLIEQAGLKGYRIGGAVVSEKHANFIINDGTAASKDIETLIAFVQAQVAEISGISLIREVHIVGDEKSL